MRLLGLTTTFAIAWFTLTRLATSPPLPLPAALAVLAAFAVLAAGLVVVDRVPVRSVASALGLGRPRARALVVAAVAGVLVLATYVAGAAVLGVTLHLRSNWPAVLVGVVLFHGLAEELVWRGFVFGRLRRRAGFRRAVWLSVPLIAATHVPILLGEGPLVGVLAIASAAVTCVPFAYLWERGGGTVWAPALLHGVIGCWQVFERSYPPGFSVVVLVATIGVPLVVLAFGSRIFGRPLPTVPLGSGPAGTDPLTLERT